MEDLLLSPIALLLALGIYFLCLMVRRAVAYCCPAFVHRRGFRDLLLPILPVALGAVLAGFAGLPLPELVAGSLVARLLYGAAVGQFSGWVYNRIKVLVRGAKQ